MVFDGHQQATVVLRDFYMDGTVTTIFGCIVQQGIDDTCQQMIVYADAEVVVECRLETELRLIQRQLTTEVPDNLLQSLVSRKLRQMVCFYSIHIRHVQHLVNHHRNQSRIAHDVLCDTVTFLGRYL